MQPSIAAKSEYSSSVLQFLAFLRMCEVHLFSSYTEASVYCN